MKRHKAPATVDFFSGSDTFNWGKESIEDVYERYREMGEKERERQRREGDKLPKQVYLNPAVLELKKRNLTSKELEIQTFVALFKQERKHAGTP